MLRLEDMTRASSRTPLSATSAAVTCAWVALICALAVGDAGARPVMAAFKKKAERLLLWLNGAAMRLHFGHDLGRSDTARGARRRPGAACRTRSPSLLRAAGGISRADALPARAWPQSLSPASSSCCETRSFVWWEVLRTLPSLPVRFSTFAFAAVHFFQARRTV